MKLNELNKYYTFHLTSYIDVGELERDTSLFVCRCSVFPKFFMSYKELVENVDSVDESTRERFRGQFKSFLNELLNSYSLYVTDKNSDTIIEVIEITSELIINLTEKSVINLFIPDLKIAMIGHDDYGFILVTEIKNPYLSNISNKLEQHVLYLVKPEKAMNMDNKRINHS